MLSERFLEKARGRSCERMLGNERSIENEKNPVADIFNFCQVVGTEEDGGSFGFFFGQEFSQLKYRRRVERCCGLIEEDQPGRSYKGHGEFDFLAHSYMLTSRHIQDAVASVEGVSAQKKDNVNPTFSASPGRNFCALCAAAISAGFPITTHGPGESSTRPSPLHTEAGA